MDLTLRFNVTAGFKLPELSIKELLCMVSLGPVGGMLPNVYGYN